MLGRYNTISLCIVLSLGAVYGAQANSSILSTKSSSEPAAKQSGSILTTKSPCDPLPAHQAADDVAYQDGKTASGKAVAGADVPGEYDSEQFKQQRIFLDIPVEDYIDTGGHNVNMREMMIGVGDVDVDAEGNVKLNGQEIAPQPVLPEGCE